MSEINENITTSKILVITSLVMVVWLKHLFVPISYQILILYLAIIAIVSFGLFFPVRFLSVLNFLAKDFVRRIILFLGTIYTVTLLYIIFFGGGK